MRHTLSRPLLFLLAASLSPGCSDGDRSVETPTVDESQPAVATLPTRHCYKNEYPFDGEPNMKDVESLTIEVNGDRAVGEYNWLPAFKDKRIGQFQGTIDDQLVTANYEYTQEGQSAVATISIRLEPSQAVVESERPELGLNATIALVDC